MDTLSDWLQTYISLATQVKLFQSVVIILVIILARAAVMRLVNRQSDDPRVRYRWRKTTNYLAVILGLLLVGRQWLAGVQSLVTYLGLLSAGLAIALQGPVTDLAGWLFIFWRRPFEVGDRIQIGDHAGDVIDVRLFQFTLLEIRNWVQADQSTGRILHVPNGLIFKEVVANYNKGFEYLWHETPVLITFESDWEKAKQLFQKIADKHAEHLSPAAEQKLAQASERYMICYAVLTPTVYTSVQDSGILLTLRYLSNPRQRRNLEQAIWEDILHLLAENPDIELAYPTQQILFRGVEAKQRDSQK
jgi:small-conductance mechanosensitive channel